MYSKIVNPLTNKYVNINSKLGQHIIQKYIELIGGAIIIPNPGPAPNSIINPEEKRRIQNKKKKARQKANKAAAIKELEAVAIKELDTKRLRKLKSILKDPDSYKISSNKSGYWFISDYPNYIRFIFRQHSEDIIDIYTQGELSLHIFKDEFVYFIKSKRKIEEEKKRALDKIYREQQIALTEQNRINRKNEFGKVKELLTSLDLNNVNKTDIDSILDTIIGSVDIALVMDFIKFNYFNTSLIMGKGDGYIQIDHIVNNLIGICKTLLILKKTNKNIYIIVPGDSGYRQMKVVQYLLNNMNINFVYIPISGIKRDNIKEETKHYFYEKIKHIPTTDLILIYDSTVQGHSITFIKTELEKNNYKNIKELEFVDAMNVKMFLESSKDGRCTPYYADVQQELTKIDNNICKYVIFFLYYKIILSAKR